MEEIWKPVKGYENVYEVSNLGNIKSIKYKGGNVERVLKPQLNKKLGYLYIGLYKNGKVSQKRIHRLVAQTFIQNNDNKPDVNHKDGNKQNNNVNNLEWCTEKENAIHYIKNNLRQYKISELHREKINVSNRKKRGKVVLQYTKEGVFIREHLSAGLAAKFINTGKGNVINCCNGKLKTVKGYVFKYKN